MQDSRRRSQIATDCGPPGSHRVDRHVPHRAYVTARAEVEDEYITYTVAVAL